MLLSHQPLTENENTHQRLKQSPYIKLNQSLQIVFLPPPISQPWESLYSIYKGRSSRVKSPTVQNKFPIFREPTINQICENSV